MENFIHNSKKKGMPDDEIVRRLNKSKWNNQQINYAIEKYSKKKTSIFEIFVNKILKKSSRKK